MVKRLCRWLALGLFLSATLHAENLTVAWDPSVDSEVSGYLLYYGELGSDTASYVSTGADTSGTVSGLVPGKTYFIYVTAVNQDGLESPPSDYVTYTSATVTTPNHPPQWSPIPDQFVPAQSPLTLQLQASDPDGDTLTYQLVSGPDGVSLDPASGLFMWVASSVPGTFPVTVQAIDSGSPALFAPQTFNISVVPANRPPILPTVPNLFIEAGGTLTWSIQATDPDLPTQVLSYRILSGPADATIEPGTGAFQWSPPLSAAGTSTSVTVQVSDNGTPALTDTGTFVVLVVPPNRAPVLDPVPDQDLPTLSPLVLHLTASDPDGVQQGLTFSLVSGPQGVVVSPDGTLSWTPTSSQAPSTNRIVVQVTDNGSPARSDSKSFVVVVQSVNRPPVLAPVPNQQALPGQLIMLALNATDPDGPANNLAYHLVSGPAGAAVDPNSGIFTWRLLKTAVASTNVITVQVSDNGLPALSATQSFTITVAAKNSPSGTPPDSQGKAAVVSWVAHLQEARAVHFVYPLGQGKQTGNWVHFLETSEDLIHWRTLGPVSEAQQLEDVVGAATLKRFYRIRSELIQDRTDIGTSKEAPASL